MVSREGELTDGVSHDFISSVDSAGLVRDMCN